MIISHKHKFIFIHNRKVAGSSITAYLNKYLGKNDLQIGCWEDCQPRNYNYRFKKDFISIRGIFSLIKEICTCIISNKTFSLNRAHKTIYSTQLPKPDHPTAKDLKAFVGLNIWNSYYKFCFVRNPYDKAVSDYKWRTRNSKNNIGFLEFLEKVNDSSKKDLEKVVPDPKTNWELYTINDRICVDFIGKFENLDEDFQKICNVLKIPFVKEDIPKAKSSKNSNKASYKHWYSKAEKKLVRKIYNQEIQQFKYKF